MNNLRKAESFYNDRLRILRKIHGEDSVDYAKSLTNQVKLFITMGKYTEAEAYAVNLVEIQRKLQGGDSLDYAEAITLLGSLYLKIGKYSEAEPLLLRSLEFYRSKLGENHPDYAISLNNLGIFYVSTGQYTMAKNLLSKLEIDHAKFTEKDLSYALYTAGIADIHSALASYSNAERYYQESLDTLRRIIGENNIYFANILNNLAQLYAMINDYDDAIDNGIKASYIYLSVSGENSQDYATSVYNLAEMYRKTENYSNALMSLIVVEGIVSKNFGEQSTMYAFTLDSIGFLLQKMGDYSSPEQYFMKAQEIYQKTLGKNNLDYATHVEFLANLYHDRGEYDKAEEYYLETHEIFRNTVGPAHPKYIQSLTRLFCLLGAQGRYFEALDLGKSVSDSEDKIITDVFSISNERHRLSFLRIVQFSLYTQLSLFVQYFSNSKEVTNTVFDLVVRRKFIELQSSALAQRALLNGKYPKLKLKVNQLFAHRAQLSDIMMKGLRYGKISTPEAKKYEDLTKLAEKLERDLSIDVYEVELQLILKSANRDLIVNKLEEGEVLIEFVKFDMFNFNAVPAKNQSQWGDQYYIAFVIHSKDSNIQMISLGDAEHVDNLIVKFRNSITDRNDTDTIMSNGSELRSIIFDPLLSAIGNCKRLYIAPDGNLNLLPFEALPGIDKVYLIESYHISYVTTARDILGFRPLDRAKCISSDSCCRPRFRFRWITRYKIDIYFA